MCTDKKLIKSLETQALKTIDFLENSGGDNPQTAAYPPRVAPSIIPIGDSEPNTFSTIRQGTATNALTKIKPDEKRNMTVDPITGAAAITEGDFSINITDFSDLTSFKLKTTTYQLLDALTVALTEVGAKSPVVSISLDEYMKKRGLKDKKTTRKQVMNDLDALFNATISFKQKSKGKEFDFHDMRIIDSKGIKNGIITVSFGTAFYNTLLGYTVMPYPSQLWRLNPNNNPNSFYLLRRIAEHKNMNISKKNEDIISVKTLLSSCPYLPTYDEVMAGDRALNRRIIEPFERDMDALNETFKWSYCNSKNTPLSDAELINIDFELFKNLLIKIDWINYPDQTRRIERKNQKIEKTKTSKNKK